MEEIKEIERQESLLFDDLIETARESGSTCTTDGIIINGGK